MYVREISSDIFSLLFLFSCGMMNDMKIKKKVDCKKIEKMIPLYLDDKLKAYETLALLEHLKICPECKEELTIQYMVSEGLNRAEIENDYNLLEGLSEKIAESYKKIKAHDVVSFGFTFCLIASFCLVAIALLIILI